jgi:GTP1/Obg family GTP-binding protein
MMEAELNPRARDAIKAARIAERKLNAPSRVLEDAVRHNLRTSSAEAHRFIGFIRTVVDVMIDVDDMRERLAAIEAKMNNGGAPKRRRGRPKGSKNRKITPTEGQDAVSG